MNADYKVIIIGGGIVGCGIIYALAKRGWTDSLLIERLELTSGSTWHAAGNCTHFGHDAEMVSLYVNSLKTYQQAKRESGRAIGFHKTGSLRLASSSEELNAYKSLVPLYQQLNIPYKVIGKDEIQKLHPLLNLEGVLGAAHTPDDGHVDPTGATMAMADAAKKLGAQIKRHCPVTKIHQESDGLWLVETEHDSFKAEHVVIATSFWAREMCEQIGLNLPLYALEHHEVITENHSAIEALGFELPTVRDPVIPGNIRQEANGLLCGVYEKHPVPWSVDGIPKSFEQELLEPNLDRLMGHLERAMWRLPAFGESGIKVANNGPICYAPDGFPLLGPVTQFDNFWLATGFHVGIGMGGGGAQFLAEWMVEGKPSVEIPSVYPSRFPADLSRDDVLSGIKSHYASGYAVPRIENLAI